MVNNKYKRIESYTVVFEAAPEGGYVARVPSLPGCATQGETFEEAQANVKDAILGYLDALQELSEEVPYEPEGTIVTRIQANR